MYIYIYIYTYIYIHIHEENKTLQTPSQAVQQPGRPKSIAQRLMKKQRGNSDALS